MTTRTAPPATAGRPTRHRVDPRIAARRRQVERDHGRRRLRRLAVAVGVIALVGLAWGATRTPLLDADHIRVSGAGQTTDDELLAASGLRTGDQLLDVDAAAVRERLLALPWVDDASVRVEWPDTVRIGVVERRAVAAVQAADGGWLLVDGDGRVLGPTTEPGWIPLEGVEVRPVGEQLGGRAGDALAVVTALAPGLRSRVDAVVVTADGVDLRVRPSGVVRLGPVDDLETKLGALTTLFARVDDTDLASVDLRVPDRPVVTRTTAPPPDEGSGG